MNILYWLLTLAAVAALLSMGVLRPTGLLARSRAEDEQDRQRDAVANWLKKDAEQSKAPRG
jgi:hypothetical protein